jgi:hypothetical protein
MAIAMTDKFRPKFLESRRVGLEYFLKSVSHRTCMISCIGLFLTSFQLCPFKPGVLGLPYCQRLPLRSSLLIESSFFAG